MNMNDPIQVLAGTAWGEARDQGPAGMAGVMHVVVNREAAKRVEQWGSGIIGVCQHREQFSCWNLGDPNRAKLEAVTDKDPDFALALLLAKRITSSTSFDPTNGSDSYVNLSVAHPSWATTTRLRAWIGAHHYYRTI